MGDWIQLESMGRRSLIKAFGAAGLATGLGGKEASASSTTTTKRTRLMEGTAQETTLYINDSGIEGITTFVVGGMHGNEPAGYLAGDDIQEWIPPSGTLLVLPRANTVAIQNGTREANGDLNRQFPLTQTPTTALARAIWRVVTEFQPDLVIDMHESVGRYIDGRLGQSVGYSPLRNGRGAAQVATDAVNGSIETTENHFHPRFLSNPVDDSLGIFVKRTAFESGVPTYIIETYRGLALSARIRWQKALVKRLIDVQATAFGAGDPHHVLAIDGSGPQTRYTVGVDGTISATDTINAHDSVGDSRVAGIVYSGVDYYHFTGRITNFDVTGGDRGDVTVYIDGVERTNDELTSQETSELRIRSTGANVGYQLGVTEPFTATRSMNGTERVFGNRAYGVADGDPDIYEYKRYIDHFAVIDGDPNDLAVDVDGQPITLDELDVMPMHDLLLRAEDATRVRFTVSGTVSGTGAFESDDGIPRNSASGTVADAYDRFRFTGEILSFEITQGSTNDLEILLDGNKRTVAELNPSDVHELRVSGNGSRTGYTFEVSDIVYPSTTITGEDHVGVDSVSGVVIERDDDYLFRGDVTSFRVASGSFEEIDVFLDGNPVPRSELNATSAGTRMLTVDEPWQTYELTPAYESPIVIVTPLSFNGSDPCHVRLRNVSRDQFEARIEEWRYLNSVHYDESVGCLAMEAGTHEQGGISVEAGRTVADHSWTRVSFEQRFGSVPIVLCQSETVQGGRPIVTRVRNVSTEGFDVRVQEEAALGKHPTETLGYIALEPGTGTLDGMTVEAGRTAVSHEWHRLSFDREYATPVFLAATQTFNGANTCGLRHRNLSGSNVETKVEEERSNDTEVNHVTETVGYLVVDG